MTEINRRGLLKMGTAAAVGTILAPGITLFQAMAEDRTDSAASSANRWGMVIDTNLCTERCEECTKACRIENNVPLFGDKTIDAHWIRKAVISPKNAPDKKTALPLLCNHCEYPPCKHVCPTAATFMRKDGLVLIDKHRCIGCRYCMIACPYKARSFVFKSTTEWTNKDVPKIAKGVVSKCHFCVHRIDAGKLPACVEVCQKGGEKAMIFGNLNDPDSEVSRYIKKYAPKQIRADLGVKPKVFYRGI
ncbi:MAG: sulfate reduction electron transfer complex DsrMKJOP subunit DsrO [Nitrospinota bacterium]